MGSGNSWPGTLSQSTPLRAVICRDHQQALRPWSSEALSITLWTTVLTLLGALTIVAVLRLLHHQRVAAAARQPRSHALAMEGERVDIDWDICSIASFCRPG